MAGTEDMRNLHMDKLSPRQKEVIQEIKKVMGDELHPDLDDQRILKFLMARNYDVNQAANMLRKHLGYWKKLGVNHVMNEYTPEEKSHHFATCMLGFDREGALVRLLRIGVSDLKGLAVSHTKLDTVLMAAYIIEHDKKLQKARFEETGEGGDDKQSHILDLEGLRWRLLFFKPLITLFVMMLRLYEANYPESLKTAYIVNAPSFFSLIYSFVKTILPNEILNKVQILSPDQFQPVLTKVMDPDILPKFLGGNKTDPDGDPYCNSLFPVVPGTPVPEKYYLSSCLSKDPEARKTIVMSSSTFSIKHQVDIPQSLLQWDFQTQDYDIAMGLLLHKYGEDEPHWIIPSKRVDCHRFIESGRLRCDEPGIYEILFDNSYSWWAKKVLTYKTQLLKPEEQEKEEIVL